MNKPNMFRVNYQVMEGNNYAGGWGDRSRDVTNLDDLYILANKSSVKLVSVVPIYKVVEVFERQALSLSEMQEAIKKGRDKASEQRKKYEIEAAERQLARAKANKT